MHTKISLPLYESGFKCLGCSYMGINAGFIIMTLRLVGQVYMVTWFLLF